MSMSCHNALVDPSNNDDLGWIILLFCFKLHIFTISYVECRYYLILISKMTMGKPFHLFVF